MKTFKIGYTTGVFDLFHIGHLNIIKSAKAECEILIVGVTTDNATLNMKGKKPIISFDERLEIVKSLKYVDNAVPKEADDIDNIHAHKKYGFDVIFKGNDWSGTVRGEKLEKDMRSVGAKVFYFPYTENTSSSLLRKYLEIEIGKQHNT